MSSKKLTPGQALLKVKQFCAWQERCHSEVAQKLYDFGLTTDEAAEAISKLIEENYLNEERFAIQYAGGKFRIKQWGRVKISFELKRKGVSSYCIKKALHAIDETAYACCFEKLVQQKKDALNGERNVFIKKRKLRDFLLAKGFEQALVNEAVNAV
ncbi:MAG TPA: regulatory protein RecX [Ferruginibacter sp.]|nr:regulatory protein RecX [Ferruginibacter sp.]HMP19877.1 regulatory protein RecX [Ferruginibacter sp.]